MVEFPDLIFEIYYDRQEPYKVVHAPVGWDKCEFEHVLDPLFRTTRKKFSTSLTFIYGSADLLRSIIYAKGSNASVQLKISKLNKETLNYEEAVLLDFDLLKVIDTVDGVSCELNNKSILSKIDASIDVVYEIDVNPSVPVNIGGIGVAQFVSLVAGQRYSDIGNMNAVTPELTVVENTSTTDIVVITPPNWWEGYLGSTPVSSTVIRVTSAFAFKARLTGHIKAGGAGLGPRDKVYFYLTNIDDDSHQIINGPVIATPRPGYSPFDFDYDVNVDLLPGKHYAFIMHCTSGNSSGNYALGFDSMSMKMEYRTYTVDYHSFGMRACDLLRALIQKIEPDTVIPVTSPVLDGGKWHNLICMSGDCVRNIPNAKIKTSLRQFILAMGAEVFAGFKVYSDNSVKMDVLSAFFNKYIHAGFIGEVKGAKYEFIKEAHYTGVVAGYDDQEYQEVEGKDEFNTEENWMLKDSVVKNNIEIKSPYRADARGTDQLLISFRANQTQDNRADTQMFMYEIEDTPTGGFYNLKGSNEFNKVEGTSAFGRIYNLNLSPRAMIERSSALLAVPMALSGQGSIDLQSSKKSASLKITKKDGNVVKEKDSFNLQNMNPALYLPIQCTFTAALADSFYKNIIEQAEKTGGFITFTDRGKLRKGFVVDSKFNLTSDNIKEFIVYLTTDNVL